MSVVYKDLRSTVQDELPESRRTAAERLTADTMNDQDVIRK